MSNSKNMTWFRLHSEAIDDEKLRLLAFEDRWHFVALLCCKSKGLLDNSDPLMLRKVALKLGLSTRELEEVARRLAEVGLVHRDTLQPLAWEKRQFQSDTSAERTRQYRERKKQSQQSQPSGVKRHGDVTVTPPDTETDTDTDNPPTPQGGEPAGSEGDVFPNLDDYVDLDDLVPGFEPVAEQGDPQVLAATAALQAAIVVPLTSGRAALVVPPSAGSACTSAGSVCLTLKAAGIADVAPGNPKLKALLDAGATLPEFLDAAQRAVAAGNPRFGYTLGIVIGERRRAAELAAQLHTGALPSKAKAADRPTFAQAQADIARSTVPGREGRDPTLARLEADAARAAPMPPEVRARLSALRRSA